MNKVELLITPSDIKTIQHALESCSEESIEHSESGCKIILSVVEIGQSREVWNQTHIIRVERFAGQVYSRKFCKDVRELREYLGI